MNKKTTKCIYCGQLVEGEVVRDNVAKTIRKSSRILGAISHALSGNPISVWRNVTGRSQDSAEKLGGKMGGGLYYRFHCSNPNCNQTFEKYVY